MIVTQFWKLSLNFRYCHLSIATVTKFEKLSLNFCYCHSDSSSTVSHFPTKKHHQTMIACFLIQKNISFKNSKIKNCTLDSIEWTPSFLNLHNESNVRRRRTTILSQSVNKFFLLFVSFSEGVIVFFVAFLFYLTLIFFSIEN